MRLLRSSARVSGCTHAAVPRAGVCCTHACVRAPFLTLHLARLSTPLASCSAVTAASPAGARAPHASRRCPARLYLPLRLRLPRMYLYSRAPLARDLHKSARLAPAPPAAFALPAAGRLHLARPRPPILRASERAPAPPATAPHAHLSYGQLYLRLARLRLAGTPPAPIQKQALAVQYKCAAILRDWSKNSCEESLVVAESLSLRTAKSTERVSSAAPAPKASEK
ncbi:hypothetical protein FB451DRAFT_1180551 [Mycena latifolia]|nr:hypothetical protein FB451DRAFT_1180551 [Mycena latifolia]